jgi:hypothetical protein
LYEIQHQIKFKLVQTFSQEHPSVGWITSLIQLNSNTLISSSSCAESDYSDSNKVIVIWSKSPKSPKSLYEPLQRITQKEAGRGIERLVLIDRNNEEEFASCSSRSIIIWRRKEGEVFKIIQQKIINLEGILALVYISRTNELISGSYSENESFYSYLLHIWSPSPSSSSDFKEKQTIKISSRIVSFCQVKETRNESRIEFASGHSNGQIMIWSKPQKINESKYSLIRTLQPFNGNAVCGLIFINENGFNNFLITCCPNESKIIVYKEKESEELKHERVVRLIHLSNGIFASVGDNRSLNIWSPFSSSS